jgi:hypothetical protein
MEELVGTTRPKAHEGTKENKWELGVVDLNMIQ